MTQIARRNAGVFVYRQLDRQRIANGIIDQAHAMTDDDGVLPLPDGAFAIRLTGGVDYRDFVEQLRVILEPQQVIQVVVDPNVDATRILGLRASLNLRADSPQPKVRAPNLLLQAAFVKTVGTVTEGDLIVAIAPVWRQLVSELSKNPGAIYQLGPRKVEELIAAGYEREGWDDVVLTPRSGDGGFDVMATKHGFGAIRIIDQVKALSPGHRVTADDVRALLGVLGAKREVSKGIVTTTAEFAPRLRDDDYIKPYLPTRLELRDLADLLNWFGRLQAGSSGR